MDVNETALPGVGLRYDFTTRSGRPSTSTTRPT
jgi:K+/H+ antiporter YhaU regulatory subunit KhtT